MKPARWNFINPLFWDMKLVQVVLMFGPELEERFWSSVAGGAGGAGGGGFSGTCCCPLYSFDVLCQATCFGAMSLGTYLRQPIRAISDDELSLSA